jgi:hypothetical protein
VNAVKPHTGPAPLGIAIAGATGRMGQMLIEAVRASDDLRLTGALDRPDSPALGQDAGYPGPLAGVCVTADLRQGLNGRVNGLVSIGACLYMGGAFSATVAEPPHAPNPLSYAARWCLDLVNSVEPSFEEIDGAAGPVQDIVSLHMYMQGAQPKDGFACPLGDNTTHCTSPIIN